MGIGFEAHEKVRFGRSDSAGNVEQSETARQGEAKPNKSNPIRSIENRLVAVFLFYVLWALGLKRTKK
mgnify:CR=1 FL=1